MLLSAIRMLHDGRELVARDLAGLFEEVEIAELGQWRAVDRQRVDDHKREVQRVIRDQEIGRREAKHARRARIAVGTIFRVERAIAPRPNRYTTSTST